MRSALFVLITAWCAAASSPAGAAAAPGESGGDPRDLCARAVADAEKSHALPRFLLHAISLAESGRWDRASQANHAWPWTVTAGDEGKFFPTREAAIAYVERLRRAGRTNIDVGCLQINLHHHADAFDDLKAAFDPSLNAAYGARFLARLMETRRSWTQAIAHYHSATRALGRRYATKVFGIWNAERRRRLEAERLARIAAWRQRREATLEARRRRALDNEAPSPFFHASADPGPPQTPTP